MERYAAYSRLARGLYGEYTDRIENFGLDEAWLDVTAVSYTHLRPNPPG